MNEFIVNAATKLVMQYVKEMKKYEVWANAGWGWTIAVEMNNGDRKIFKYNCDMGRFEWAETIKD